MEDSMIDIPNMVFDEKIGNKRVRDGEEEFNTGRLEKRPSGILGVNGGADYIKDGGDKDGESGGGGGGGGGCGIIDTFLSNVFNRNENGIKEEEDGSQMKNNVFDAVEEKREDLGGGGSEGHDGDGGNGERGGVGGGSEGGDGGGIINAFFSNIFHRNESGDDGDNDGDRGGENDQDGDGGRGDSSGGELENLNAEKQVERNDKVVDSSSKDLEGQKFKLKPDEYSERVFFLNNN